MRRISDHWRKGFELESNPCLTRFTHFTFAEQTNDLASCSLMLRLASLSHPSCGRNWNYALRTKSLPNEFSSSTVTISSRSSLRNRALVNNNNTNNNNNNNNRNIWEQLSCFSSTITSRKSNNSVGFNPYL